MAYTFRHGDRPLAGITVQRAVGRGGFGEVYYALTDSGKQVALKYLRDNPDIELRGISHVMNLKSPHLITIYDVRRNEAGEPFVIMEYVSGPSLRDLLVAEPAGLGAQKAAFFLCGIAKGLSYLHERGIVHRDLKPGNIFYDDGYVKIGDYGLSKHISVSRHSGQTVSVGTVHYMAPEVGSGDYTRAIDIYALGVILFEMLTGRLPFTGASMAEILMRHLNERPDVSALPEPFAGVIAKALAKNPSDRFENVNEMVDALLSSATLTEELAGFDPSSLTAVPRSEDRSDPDRTLTTPPRHSVPSLDVRGAGLEMPPRLTARAAEKSRRFQEKLEQVAARLGRASRPGVGSAGAASRGAGGPTVGQPATGRQCCGGFAAAGTAAILLIASAIGMSVLHGAATTVVTQDASGKVRRDQVRHQPEMAIALVLFMSGATAGPLLSYFWMLRRSPARSPVVDRLVCAGAALGLMAIGLGPGADLGQDFQRLIFAPVGGILLCDWIRRIENGRRGRVRVGEAFWPALIGLVVAAMVEAEDYEWVAAGMCAVIVLATQVAAAMLPFGSRVSALPAAGPAEAGAPGGPTAAGAATGAGGALQHAGRVLERAWSHAARRVQSTGASADAARGRAESAGPRRSVGDPAVLADVDLQQLEAARPSFVGRVSNAGLALAGKLLLVIGLFMGLAFGAIEKAEREAHERTVAMLRAQGKESSVPLAGHGEVPAGLPLAPLALGAILLVLSRRNDGAAHFLRALAGCTAGLATVIVARSAAREPLRILLTENDWTPLTRDELYAPLLIVAALTVASLALLFWPRPRGPRPIVI